jgi:hypothetical protein
VNGKLDKRDMQNGKQIKRATEMVHDDCKNKRLIPGNSPQSVSDMKKGN